MAADVVSIIAAGVVTEKEDIPSLRFFLGVADVCTNSLGELGGALGTTRGWMTIPV
jgi:hypothetical protein